MLDELIVAVQVPAGVIAVASGAVAMLARKGSPTHKRCGRIYLASFAVVVVTGVFLVALRSPGFAHLLALGCIAAVFALAGYRARLRPRPALHLLAMSGSYVVTLTAFYVDNGPKLPGWRLLPPLSFWFLPTLVAAPLIVRALRRHSGRGESQPAGG